MIKRQGIIVYLYYNRDLRKIAKFGDVVYHSYKMRYVHLYVDQDRVEDILTELEGSLERYDTSVPEHLKNFSL